MTGMIRRHPFMFIVVYNVEKVGVGRKPEKKEKREREIEECGLPRAFRFC